MKDKTIPLIILFIAILAAVIWYTKNTAGPNRSTVPSVPVAAKEDTGQEQPTADPATTGGPPQHAEAKDTGETEPASAVFEKNAPVLKEELAYLPDELILRASEHTTLKRLESELDKHGIKIIRSVDQLGLVRVKLPEGLTVPEAEKMMKDIGDVSETIRNISTEVPKQIRELPMLGPGQMIKPVRGEGKKLIKMGDALEQTTYGNGVIVALLDTGVDATHPDLSDRIIGGYNFVDDNADVTDVNTHGTACAGIISANSKSTEGVRGIAPEAYLLPVKVMNDTGKGESFAVIEGIVYAVDQGAKVLNLSIGTRGLSSALNDAITYAVDKGVLIVAAAGNDGTPEILMPAGYKDVICVGAVDGNLQYAPFSNYGDKLDIVAPGVAINTTAPEGGYLEFSGTSAAAPFVSGALAALISKNPYETSAKIRERLLAGADNLGYSGRDEYYGEGMLNIKRALAKETDTIYDAAVSALFFEPNELILGQPTVVHFILENQGNKPLSNAKFVYKFGNERYEESLGTLDPGECIDVAKPWFVPVDVPDTPITIEGIIIIDRADSEPLDNGRGVTLRLSDWI
jgi:subtilisin family serine protease